MPFKFKVFTATGSYLVTTEAEWEQFTPFSVAALDDATTDSSAAMLKDRLENNYGHFGHIVGESCAPADLIAAIKNLQRKGLVKSADFDGADEIPVEFMLPAGAAT